MDIAAMRTIHRPKQHSLLSVYLQLLDTLDLHHYEIIDVLKRPELVEHMVYYNVSYYVLTMGKYKKYKTRSMFSPFPWLLLCFVLKYSPFHSVFG